MPTIGDKAQTRPTKRELEQLARKLTNHVVVHRPKEART